MHEEVEPKDDSPKLVCKFYKKRTGDCKFGDACKFYHPSESPAPSAVPPRATAAWTATDFMGSADGGDREQDHDERVKLCMKWINTGRCPCKNTCKLRHGTLGVPIGKARAQWAAERRQRRADMPSTPGDDVPSQDKQGYRARAAVLASWMTSTFSKQDLANGVLDVAGGRGELSFELSVSHSLNCTVVDPRPVRLNKYQHRRLSEALVMSKSATEVIEAAQRRQHALERARVLRAEGKVDQAVALLRSCAAPAATSTKEVEDAGTGVRGGGGREKERAEEEEVVEEEDLFFQADPVDDMNKKEDEQSISFHSAGEAKDSDLAAALQSCKSSDEPCNCGSFVLSQRQEWFGARFAEGGDLHHVTSGSGVLCGLHPDEATDHIVSIALAEKKPFCIVPCCVMRSRVPRLDPSGKLVTSYEDYVKFLKAKHPSIQQAFLPFIGKNLVLYKTSSD